MDMLALRAVVAVALVAAVAAPSAAQEPQEIGSWRIPGWSFTPTLGAGLLWDNNVALSSPRADQTGTQGDTLFHIEPSGQIEYYGRRTEFSGTYRGNLRRYFEVEGLNTFNQRAGVSLRHEASPRVSFYVRNSFADAPTTDEVEVNGVPFLRTGSRSNSLAGEVATRLTRTLGLTTRYDMTWVTFDRQDEFLTGGWIHALQGELAHRATSRLSAGAEYGFRWAELELNSRSLTFQDVGGVLRYELARRTSWSVSGGFSVLNDKTVDQTRTGPYIKTAITHQMQRAAVGASFDRQFVPSFGFGGSSSNHQVRSWIHTPFNRGRIFVNGSFTWRRSTPFEEESLQVDTIWLRSSVGYALTRWARVEGLYTYTQQDSIVTGGEVDRHRLGGQVVISQPVRIR
jgi:hypothetical protein